MKNTQVNKRFEDLQRAAGFDANRTYPALFQHLGYRKCIAEQLLREVDEEKLRALNDVYDCVNSGIKLIIGF